MDPFAMPTRTAHDVGPVFIAAYDGTCNGCGNELYEGEEARFVDGVVVAQDCCGGALDE